jgi:hypothetical protein
MGEFARLAKEARENRAAGNFAAASALFTRLAEQLNSPANAYLEAALCAALGGDLAETARLFERFFWSAEKPNVANLNDLISLYHLTQRPERVAEAVTRLFPPLPDDHPRSGRKQRQAMFFALPKSAGTSVVQTLAETLRIRYVASGSDDTRVPGYSAAVLEPAILERLSGRDLLHQTHAMPWRENLEKMREYCYRKFIVHLRDPRDALLSYYYMAEKYELHRLRLLLMYPDYDRLPPIERMELLARKIYPNFLEWIIGWTAAADAAGGRAMVTSFERFKREPEPLLSELTRFLGGRELPLAPVRKTHFRKGKSGQKDDPLLPAELRERLYEQIPHELCRRFDWAL